MPTIQELRQKLDAELAGVEFTQHISKDERREAEEGIFGYKAEGAPYLHPDRDAQLAEQIRRAPNRRTIQRLGDEYRQTADQVIRAREAESALHASETPPSWLDRVLGREAPKPIAPAVPVPRPEAALSAPKSTVASTPPASTPFSVPAEERAFQDWYAGHAKRLGLSPNPDDPAHRYDYRGAFAEGVEPNAQGHWPDTFKLPGHPTFSDESRFATGEAKTQAGHWEGERFVPPAPSRESLASSIKAPGPIETPETHGLQSAARPSPTGYRELVEPFVEAGKSMLYRGPVHSFDWLSEQVGRIAGKDNRVSQALTGIADLARQKASGRPVDPTLATQVLSDLGKFSTGEMPKLLAFTTALGTIPGFAALGAVEGSNIQGTKAEQLKGAVTGAIKNALFGAELKATAALGMPQRATAGATAFAGQAAAEGERDPEKLLAAAASGALFSFPGPVQGLTWRQALRVPTGDLRPPGSNIFARLGLDPDTATLSDVRKAFANQAGAIKEATATATDATQRQALTAKFQGLLKDYQDLQGFLSERRASRPAEGPRALPPGTEPKALPRPEQYTAGDYVTLTPGTKPRRVADVQTRDGVEYVQLAGDQSYVPASQVSLARRTGTPPPPAELPKAQTSVLPESLRITTPQEKGPFLVKASPEERATQIQEAMARTKPTPFPVERLTPPEAAVFNTRQEVKRQVAQRERAVETKQAIEQALQHRPVPTQREVALGRETALPTYLPLQPRQQPVMRPEAVQATTTEPPGVLPEPVETKREATVPLPEARSEPINATEPHEFATTQMNLPAPLAEKVRSLAAKIPDKDLAEDGREANPHITVKYGLHGDDPEAVRRIVENQPPIKVILGAVSVFPATKDRPSDVIKIDVRSPALTKLNATISKALPNTETQSTYEPHITLAYVKAGRGEQYAKKLRGLKGTTVTLGHLTFSDRNRQEVTIPLKGVAQAQQGKAAQQGLPMPVPLEIGQRPIIGREATLEEAPLFSKQKQTEESEQGTLLQEPQREYPEGMAPTRGPGSSPPRAEPPEPGRAPNKPPDLLPARGHVIDTLVLGNPPADSEVIVYHGTAIMGEAVPRDSATSPKMFRHGLVGFVLPAPRPRGWLSVTDSAMRAARYANAQATKIVDPTATRLEPGAAVLAIAIPRARLNMLISKRNMDTRTATSLDAVEQTVSSDDWRLVAAYAVLTDAMRSGQNESWNEIMSRAKLKLTEGGKSLSSPSGSQASEPAPRYEESTPRYDVQTVPPEGVFGERYHVMDRLEGRPATNFPSVSRERAEEIADYLNEGGVLHERRTAYPTRATADRQRSLDLSRAALADLDRAARDVSTLAGALDRPDRGREKPRTVAQDFRPDLIRTGRIDLRGQTVTSSRDLAMVAQVFRDPRFETFRLFYTKDGKIVAHEGVTSRLAGSTSAWVDVKPFDTVAQETYGQPFATLSSDQQHDVIRKTRAPAIDKMKRRMERLGADGYWLLHNHPSGSPAPSREDLSVTQMYRLQVPGLKGHVVINSGTYAVIEPDTSRTRLEALPEGFVDQLREPPAPSPIVGTPLRTTLDLLKIGKGIQHSDRYVTVLYWGGSDGKVRAIQEVPVSLFTSPQAANYLRNQARQLGGMGILTTYQGAASHAVEGTARQLIEEGVLLDHAMVHTTVQAQGAILPRPGAPGVTGPAGQLRGLRVQEPSQRYDLKAIQAQAERTRKENRGAGVPPSPPPSQPPGPPAGSDTPRPPDELPKYAASVNLHRLGTSQDIKAEMVRLAESGAVQKQAPTTFDAVMAAADELGYIPEDLDKLRSRVKGLGAKITAARDVQHAIQEQAEVARQQYRQQPTAENFARFTDAQQDRLKAFQAVSDIAHEAGLALATHRIDTRSVTHDAALRADKALLELTERKGAIPEELAKWEAQLDLSSPLEVQKFLLAVGSHTATLRDKVFEYYLSSILSGPKTHMVNMTSNAINLVLRPVEQAAAGVVDQIVSNATGRPQERFAGEGLATIYGMREGLRDGLTAFARSFANEVPMSGEARVDVRRRVAITGTKGRIIRIPLRLLMAEDELVKAIAFRGAVARQAYRQAQQEQAPNMAERVASLTREPTPEMIDAAREEARYVTFQDTSALSEWVLKARDRVPGLEYLIPFVRTPVNIVRYGLHRTPLNWWTVMRGLNNGTLSGGALSEQVALSLLGTLMASVVTMAVSEGLLAGGGSPNPNRRRVLYEAGWAPYSIKIGDRYVSYGRLEPFGMSAGLVADFAELLPYLTAEETSQVGPKLAQALATNLTNKTFLGSLNDFLEAWKSGDQRKWEGLLHRLASGFVPNLGAQLGRAINPELKEVRSLLDAIRERIPMVREGLPPRRGLLGDPIRTEATDISVLDAVYQLLSPSRITEAKTDALSQALRSLNVSLGKPQDTITIHGHKIKMTPQTYDTYQAQAGAAVKAALTRTVHSGTFRVASDETKVSLLKKAAEEARDEVRERLRPLVQRQHTSTGGVPLPPTRTPYRLPATP